jgi:hypothetical protein
VMTMERRSVWSDDTEEEERGGEGRGVDTLLVRGWGAAAPCRMRRVAGGRRASERGRESERGGTGEETHQAEREGERGRCLAPYAASSLTPTGSILGARQPASLPGPSGEPTSTIGLIPSERRRAGRPSTWAPAGVPTLPHTPSPPPASAECSGGHTRGRNARELERRGRSDDAKRHDASTGRQALETNATIETNSGTTSSPSTLQHPNHSVHTAGGAACALAWSLTARSLTC